MNEESARPDVASLLKCLREQARQPREGVHFHEGNLVQHISQSAAAVSGL